MHVLLHLNSAQHGRRAGKWVVSWVTEQRRRDVGTGSGMWDVHCRAYTCMRAVRRVSPRRFASLPATAPCATGCLHLTWSLLSPRRFTPLRTSHSSGAPYLVTRVHTLLTREHIKDCVCGKWVALPNRCAAGPVTSYTLCESVLGSLCICVICLAHAVQSFQLSSERAQSIHCQCAGVCGQWNLCVRERSGKLPFICRGGLDGS